MLQNAPFLLAPSGLSYDRNDRSSQWLLVLAHSLFPKTEATKYPMLISVGLSYSDIAPLILLLELKTSAGMGRTKCFGSCWWRHQHPFSGMAISRWSELWCATSCHWCWWHKLQRTVAIRGVLITLGQWRVWLWYWLYGFPSILSQFGPYSQWVCDHFFQVQPFPFLQNKSELVPLGCK